MSKSFPALTDGERYHRDQTSKAMKRMAASNQCPQCKRKAALKRTVEGDLWMVNYRWCGYGKGGYLGGQP